MEESKDPDEVWTELPSSTRRVLVTAYRTPQGFVVTFATGGVKTRTELMEILEAASGMASRLKAGSGPNGT